MRGLRPPKKGLYFSKVQLEEEAVDILWALLQEREPHQNISHREMPDYEEHAAFVADHPYRAWYLIKNGPVAVGSVYLTRRNEIGIFIFNKYQGQGYGSWALASLIRRWQSSLKVSKASMHYAFFANIAPDNALSRVFFERAGFRHIQNTYAFDIERIYKERS